MTDLLKTVQWVLDFVNIYQTPGKFNPYTYPAKIKRIPIPRKKDLPNLVIENDRIINRSTGDEWIIIREEPNIDTFEMRRQIEELEARIRELLEKHPGQREEWQKRSELIEKEYAEEKKQKELNELRGLVSSNDIEKKIRYRGNTTDLGLEIYKDFFLKNGVPPFTGKELLLENREPLSTLDTESFAKRPKTNNDDGFYKYYQDDPPIEVLFDTAVDNVRCELSRILCGLIRGTETYRSLVLGIDHIKDLYRKYGCKDNPIIPGVLYACIADSGIDDQDICSRLRECPYCGRFWITKRGRGRVQKYCSEECEIRFNQQSRETDNTNKKKNRKHRHDETKPKIIKWLLDNHYEQSKAGAFRNVDKTRANKIYDNELPGKAKTSMKEFFRIWAKPKGY